MKKEQKARISDAWVYLRQHEMEKHYLEIGFHDNDFGFPVEYAVRRLWKTKWSNGEVAILCIETGKYKSL